MCRRASSTRCLVAGFLVLASAAVAGCTAARGSAGTVTPSGSNVEQVGVRTYPAGSRPAVTPFTGKTLDGAAFSLSDYAGAVTVINVWASWCGPCRDESPMLAQLARTAGAGVRFVGLDELDSRSAAVSFVASVGATYPDVTDAEGALLARLRLLPTKAIPSTMVLDADQRVVGTIVGPATRPALLGLISAARSH